MTTDDLIKKIEQWANDRNLIKGATTNAQFIKLIEETGELAGGIARNDEDIIKDSFGDVFVVLTIMAAQLGLDFNECIQMAYDEIKDRKGKMIDGFFVKEEDL